MHPFAKKYTFWGKSVTVLQCYSSKTHIKKVKNILYIYI